MYIILGGTGHVGSAAARALLERGEPVTVVGHDPSKAAQWERRGATFAVADIHDADALRALFRTGRRAFLLNPPADPATDTDEEEKSTVAAILAALDRSGLEKIVAESTYGAQTGSGIGDLGTLYELEEGLKAQPIPATIQRAAYYYSNWDMALKSARGEGVIDSVYPADFVLPMVSPEDLGRNAARLLAEPAAKTGLHYVEGPRRYTPADVARAFADALGRPVEVRVAPRNKWVETFRKIGFSAAAADSYAAMTAITLDGAAMPDNPVHGSITIENHVAALITAEARTSQSAE